MILNGAQVISRMADDLEGPGPSFLLASSTLAMAEHAADLGLIAKAALADIAADIKATP